MIRKKTFIFPNHILFIEFFIYICSINIKIDMTKKKKNKKQGQQFPSPEKYIKQIVRSLEIGKCYISHDIKESGEANIIVTRKHTRGRISMATYLVDIFCTGVKDTAYHLRLEEEEFNNLLRLSDDLCECSYNEAHNWIFGAIAFAEEAGITPNKAFNLTKYFLEEDTDDIPHIEYEYGKDGQHFLVANSNLEASRYLPLLKKNLGEGNFKYIINDYGYEDDDFDDDFMEYTYKHPVYPKKIELHNPWIFEELSKFENSGYLKKELIDRIFSLPSEDLRHDLEQIILYRIGQTCDNIPDDFDKDNSDGSLRNAIVLLAEVGTADTSLDVILEVMRQNEEFFDYHFFDLAYEILVPTLYKIGQNSLDRLMEYMQEEGLYCFAKGKAVTTVVQIAYLQPERRGEVIEWFRQLLNITTKLLPEYKAFDGTLAGLIITDVVDLKATELEQEIKQLFDTDLIDTWQCGTYKSVINDMNDPNYIPSFDPIILDVYERFDDFRAYYDDVDY